MRIGIIGHFGGNENFVDGQSVKVKSLHKALSTYAPSVKIDMVDTYYMHRSPVKFILSFLKSICLDRRIVFFPASRGRQYMFKTFYFLGKIIGIKFYHDCIAGSLDKEVVEHPNWVKYLNSFQSNWMESPEQVDKLKKMGVNNPSYLPNFKQLTPINLNELKQNLSVPYKFVCFSRIEEKKGIEDALNAIKEINMERGIIVAKLDLYGPIQKGSEEWFDNVKKNYADICSYKGIIDPFESVNALKSYFALLFPTQYYTEGMPGTIVDAMFAGLPAICRRWIWCDNMIKSGYNGISYDFDKPELLKSILQDLIDNPAKILGMKANCLQESQKYSEKTVISTVLKEMGIDN